MSLPDAAILTPEWPAPASVRVISTTRIGGVSRGPFAEFNLGDGAGDEPGAVAENRRRLASQLPAEPRWLRQVHGTHVVEWSGDEVPERPTADGAWTSAAGIVCTVMTADCLPVVLCDRSGTRVAVAHAGWRGLAAGVLEAAVGALGTPPGELLAWLGPAIGPGAFEVGDDVYTAFTGHDPGAAEHFTRRGEKWLADLFGLARQRLAAVGVTAVWGGGECTYSQPERFFSYRRDGARTGRMATCAWLASS